MIFYAWQVTSASTVKSSIRIKSLADTSLGGKLLPPVVVTGYIRIYVG